MSDARMTALVVSQPNCFEVREVARPIPGPDEALVRVRYSAICGSDLKLIRGRMEEIVFPLIPGHEWSGEVVEAPRAFRRFVGRPVVSDILQACGACEDCARGYRNLCSALTEPGISVDGAYAQYILVKAKQLYLLPAALPPERACMVEPLSVVLYAMQRLRLEGGERILIFGGGAIGQLLAQVVRLAGASRVVLVDHHDERLEVARRLGADVVVNPKKNNLKEFLSDHQELKPELVFEASGSAWAFRECLEIVRPGGRVGVIGYAGRDKIAIEPAVFMRKLLQLRGVLSPTGSWDRAIDLLANQSVRVDPLLTHRFPLVRFAEGFDLAERRVDGVLRVVIEP